VLTLGPVVIQATLDKLPSNLRYGRMPFPSELLEHFQLRGCQLDACLDQPAGGSGLGYHRPSLDRQDCTVNRTSMTVACQALSRKLVSINSQVLTEGLWSGLSEGSAADRDVMRTRLRQLREHKGLTQKEVAERLKMTEAGYRHWESGRSEPTFSVINQLAEALGVPVLALFDEAAFEAELAKHPGQKGDRVRSKPEPPADEPSEGEWLAAFAPANPEVVTRKVLEDIAPELREMLRGVISEELDRRLTASTETVQKRRSQEPNGGKGDNEVD